MQWSLQNSQNIRKRFTGKEISLENELVISERLFHNCRITRMAIVRSHQPLLQTDFLFKFSKTGKQFKEYLDILHTFTRKVSRKL